MVTTLSTVCIEICLTSVGAMLKDLELCIWTYAESGMPSSG
jgi:hypothetical protein